MHTILNNDIATRYSYFLNTFTVHKKQIICLAAQNYDCHKPY